MASIPETHADLVNGVVALVTVNPDGYPQVTAVVTRLEDDGKIHTSVNNERQKYKNLAERPKATLFAIDPADSFRTVEVRADVELIPDPDKSWIKAFITDPNFDVDAIDQGAERFHVVFTPAKVNTLPPAGA